MKPIASWCAFFVFNSAWQLLLLTAVAAILVRVPAKLPNRLQYQIWVSCLLLSVAVPGVSTYLGFVPSHSAGSAEHIPDDLRWKVARQPERGRLILHLTEVKTTNTSWPVCGVVAGLYGLSVLIGLGSLLRLLEKTRHIVGRRQPYEALGASVPTFKSRGLSGPATVSWPRPMIGQGGESPTAIARPAVEAAVVMHFINDNLLTPWFRSREMWPVTFRVGIEIGSVTVARVGIHGQTSSLVAIGTPANVANKIMKLIPNGGICIGNSIKGVLPLYWDRKCTQLTGATGFVFKGTTTPYPAWELSHRLTEPTS